MTLALFLVLLSAVLRISDAATIDTRGTPKARSTEVECTPGSTAIIPHPTKCAQYIDCGDNTKVWRWPLHLKECKYGEVFDTNTMKCEYYWTVNCGDRVEPLSLCDYEINLCRASHCIPCYVMHPSCKGLPDGLNPWVGREWSPRYVVCENQRVVYEGRCTKSGYPLFHPKKKACITPYAYYVESNI